MIAAASFHPHTTSTLHGEYFAIIFDLQIVAAHGLSCDTVESDSMQLILDIQKGEHSASCFGTLFFLCAYCARIVLKRLVFIKKKILYNLLFKFIT